MTKAVLGVIAGTGFYDLGIFEGREVVEIETPYGKPSSPYEVGLYNGKGVAFLPRHGKEHTIPPHKVNFQANIWGLNNLGVEKVLGINSMGSLKLEITPPCIAVPGDYVNFFSVPTFYDTEVKHVTPELDAPLRENILEAARDINVPVHDGGVAIQTTGPRFETPAEVKILANWGDFVGMNMASEATLCKELEMPFANIASIDNYASGLSEEKPSFELCLENSKKNREKMLSLVKAAIEKILAD